MFFYVNVPQKDRDSSGSSRYRVNSNNILYYRPWANEVSGELNQTVFFLVNGKTIVSSEEPEYIDSLLGNIIIK